MGSGKTSVGKVLARQLCKKFVDVDSIIEVEQNSSISDIFENEGEDYFRGLEQKCINELTQKTGQVIATGGGLPIYSSISKKSLIVYIRPLLQDESRAKALFNQRINTYKELATFSVDANQSIPTFIHVALDFILDQRVL
jgi:shikimate kinase